ncbi:MAG: alpha/beta fold hydrolase [Gammaproteobacteria bacterium]|nr:alpha/beta fold hydrolase [Gammaproteobacteria bacterium]
MNAHPLPPSLSLALSELPRASLETGLSVLRLPRLIRQHRGGDGHPVLVLPGYGAADGTTRLLQYFLKKIGYAVYGLELGRNLEAAEDRIRSIDDATRFRETMTPAVIERVETLHRDVEQPLSLVGWSMGGLYAHDASGHIPEKVRQVITLGSPFGDPRGTSLFMLMRRLSGSEVPLEEQDFDGWLQRAQRSDASVRTHVVYSKRDGIVGDGVAKLATMDHVIHVEIDSSHVAFPSNSLALATIAEILKSA